MNAALCNCTCTGTVWSGKECLDAGSTLRGKAGQQGTIGHPQEADAAGPTRKHHGPARGKHGLGRRSLELVHVQGLKCRQIHHAGLTLIINGQHALSSRVELHSVSAESAPRVSLSSREVPDSQESVCSNGGESASFGVEGETTHGANPSASTLSFFAEGGLTVLASIDADGAFLIADSDQRPASNHGDGSVDGDAGMKDQARGGLTRSLNGDSTRGIGRYNRSAGGIESCGRDGLVMDVGAESLDKGLHMLLRIR